MYLSRERTKESYFEKISVQAKGTQRNARFAIKKFEDFVESRFDGRSSEDIISELLALKETKQDSALFDLLQDYVNYMNSVAVVPNTIHNYFSILKGYLTYRGLKIHQEEVKQNVKFPKITHEERHGLTVDEIKKILDHASPKRKALYLTLLSSGMRIEEACALRKRDFDDSLERIQIHLPAAYTKTKKARTTFISEEAAKYVRQILTKINPDKLVFGVNEDKTAAKLVELNYFGRLRKRAGLSEKYGTGVHKITIHSFRAWFITRCSAINENVGHALAGHEYYMKSYDRLSNEEKLKVYLKVEPSLGIYSQPLSVENEHKINEAKIKTLEETAVQLTERLERQESMTAELQLIHSKINEILNRESNPYDSHFPDGGPFDTRMINLEVSKINDKSMVILDTEFEERIDVVLKEDKIYCKHDRSSNCKHVLFALGNPEFYQLVKKSNIGLPFLTVSSRTKKM